MKTESLIICTLLLFAVSCTDNSQSQLQDKNKTIQEEITKLGSLNSVGRLYPNNFSALISMLPDNERALDEIREIETLSKYREYEHVFHGLEFLSDYVSTGKKVICPGHSLLHFYVFMRHNETDFANDNFQEAKDNFLRWIPLARSFNEKNNIVQDFNYTSVRLQEYIGRIEAGNTTGTEDDIDWLSSDGSICVEGNESA